LATKAGFAVDSPLEGDGFEPSVPQQIRSDLRTAGPSPITVDSLATRNWKFESISLQGRVRCEPDSTAEDDQVVEHPVTGVIAKRVGSSWIDVLARLLLQESRSVPPGFAQRGL
jgi:hypothetical protein